MHTSLFLGFPAVSVFDYHQRSALLFTTHRCVFNTRWRVDLTREHMFPTRRLLRPLPRRYTFTYLLCQSSGPFSGSWAQGSLTFSLLLMLRSMKTSFRIAASSGQLDLFENGSSEVTSEDTFGNGSSWNPLLLIFGHFTLLFSLLLLSVTLLCFFPVTLFWLLLTPIQLGFGLLINVVYF